MWEGDSRERCLTSPEATRCHGLGSLEADPETRILGQAVSLVGSRRKHEEGRKCVCGGGGTEECMVEKVSTPGTQGAGGKHAPLS